MAVTLDDIAKRLGVNKSTVSVTLRGHPKAQRFSTATKQRIRQAAKEMGYRPNFFASQLTNSTPKVLMLCLSYLRDTYASVIAEAFEHRAAERGYRVFLSVFQGKEDPMLFNRNILGQQGVRSMAVIGATATKLTDQAIRQLVDEGVQITMVGRCVADCPGLNHVLSDDRVGARLAAECLYGRGLRRVWVMTGTNRSQFRERVNAYQEVAASVGAAPPKLISSEAGAWRENAIVAMQQALAEDDPPEGVLAVGDTLAVGAVQALGGAGLVVGKDVAVIGYDGGLYSECCNPPLTSVRQPMEQMGVAGADMLIDTLEGNVRMGQKIVLTPRLVVRESSLIANVSEC